jgi:hypothetical protein
MDYPNDKSIFPRIAQHHPLKQMESSELSSKILPIESNIRELQMLSSTLSSKNNMADEVLSSLFKVFDSQQVLKHIL